MPVSNTFFIKKLEQFKEIYVLFSDLTRMPYVECDDENGNDCVYFFSDAKKAADAVKDFKDKKAVRVNAGTLPSNRIKAFVAGLYGIGVNIVILEEEEKIQIPIQMLSESPDFSKLPDNNIPYMNPQAQLTALYFLQEARRKIIRADEDKRRIRDMEEEMSVNFFRSKFIVALDNTIEIQPDENGKKNYKLPMLKAQNGMTLLPVYTDVPEFKKMNAKFRDMKFRLLPVPYKDLTKFIAGEVKGVAINPAGFNLVLTVEQLNKLWEMYGQDED